LPADKVIFEEEAAAASNLLTSRQGYVSGDEAFSPCNSILGAADVPGGSALYRPTLHREYLPEMHGGIALVHRYIGSRGRAVVVCVQYTCIRGSPTGGSRSFLFQKLEVRPTQGAARQISALEGTNAWITLDKGQRIRVFAAQLDPTKKSHFSIRYQVNGHDGVIDGWVRDAAPAAEHGDVAVDLVRRTE
jgi:hypothetical protein